MKWTWVHIQRHGLLPNIKITWWDPKFRGPEVICAGQRWTLPLISWDETIHHFFWEGREKDKKVADAHFSPHFWLQRGDRHSRWGKFPTYFPTEIFPVRTQKDSQRRPFGIQAMFSWRLKKRALLVVVKVSVMSEPHYFNKAGTFCLVQNCSLLTADVFFGHLKSCKKKKTSCKNRHFSLLPSSTKEMQQNVHRHENTTGVDVLLSNKAFVMWVRRQKSKSMSFVLVSIYKFNRNGCSNEHDHLRQHLTKISPVFTGYSVFSAFSQPITH